MTCESNCSSCNCSAPQYEEFNATKEYKIGEFFYVNDEVFKAVTGGEEDCPSCDLPYAIRCTLRCTKYERSDGDDVEFILYDTFEENNE